VRLRIATFKFSPTPHHPKVVALIKAPFPLPDVVADKLQMRRRAVSPKGIARSRWDLNGGAPDGGRLVLTAEEMVASGRSVGRAVM
jgi:hypothetical protein